MKNRYLGAISSEFEEAYNKNRILGLIKILERFIEKYPDYKVAQKLNSIKYMYPVVSDALFADSSDAYLDLKKIKCELFGIYSDLLHLIDAEQYPYSPYIILSMRYSPEEVSAIMKDLLSYISEYETDLGDETLVSKIEKKENDLFNALLVSKDIPNELSVFIIDDTVRLQSRILAVIALFVGGCIYFNEERLSVLLKVYASSSGKLKYYSGAGIALILMRFSRYFTISDSSLADDFNSICKNDDFENTAKQVFLECVRLGRSRYLQDKMENELLPDLKNLQKELKKKFKGDFLNTEMLGLDFNPEWQDMLQKSGMLKKMQDLQDLQQEGLDMMKTPLSKLKSFPFFNEAANWLRPFDLNHSSLKNLNSGIKSILNTLQTVGGMCDSDMYSLALSVASMPTTAAESIEQQLGSQMEQMKDVENQQNSDSIRCISGLMQDLDRFYTLSDFKAAILSPINYTPAVNSIGFGTERLFDFEFINLLADICLKTQDYLTASIYYSAIVDELIIGDNPHSHEILQKVAYSFQMLGQYDEAIRYYLTAYDSDPDNSWLIKKLAFCYRLKGNNKEAAVYFRKALEKEPENTSLIINLANILLDSGETQEAVNLYYKANYFDESGDKLLPAIAWCEFLLGHYDKSRSHYERLLFADPKPEDYMNFAHLCLCEGNIKEAMQYYKEGIVSAGDDPDWFGKAMKQDRDILVKKGIDNFKLDILIDTLLK